MHVRWHPLRGGDLNLYWRVKNRRYTLGKERVEKRKRVQAKYRQKRKARMDISFHAGPADEAMFETERT